ncbi:MAG: pyridoxal 5'-phosphate synthase, partial [Myroides sp.]
ERQVIIKGTAEKQTEAYSEGYFHSRPKGSQIGTVVSPQSTVIPNREFLDEKLKSLESEYQNMEVPKPENWGGVLVKPVSIEFWQGRANRLHDRIRYTLLESGDWKIERLAP